MSLPKVLVLTPMKDAEAHLATYIAGLERLSYPRHALSLGVLEGDSRDGTPAVIRALEPRFRARVARFQFWQKNFGFQMPPSVPRWASAYQKQRRSVLARSRNHLLMRSLQDEDWVLWLDVDVVGWPEDLIETLISFGRDILHPHCVREAGGSTFDLNAWREKGRLHMGDLRGSGGPVRLDTVGGTVLLVRADVHRDGLIFPPFPYGLENPHIRASHPDWGRGEIETEGLGIMARDMGLQCWGLPDYEVIHYDET